RRPPPAASSDCIHAATGGHVYERRDGTAAGPRPPRPLARRPVARRDPGPHGAGHRTRPDGAGMASHGAGRMMSGAAGARTFVSWRTSREDEKLIGRDGDTDTVSEGLAMNPRRGRLAPFVMILIVPAGGTISHAHPAAPPAGLHA